MRRLVRHISALYVVNAVNGVLGVVFVPVALHRLGPAGYGLFSIYSVLSSYVVLVELGLGKNLVRILSGSRSSDWRRDQLRLALGLYLAACGLLVLLLPLLAWITPRWIFPVGSASRDGVQLIVIFSVLEYVLAVPTAILANNCIAEERFGHYARFQLVSGLVRYGLSFLAVLLFNRPELVVGVVVGRRVLDGFLARVLMGGLPVGSWLPRWSAQELRRIVGHSSVLSLAQFLQLTVVALGSLLVNAAFGLRALGVYRAVFDLAGKLWFFSNVVGFVVFPRFVRMLSLPEERDRLRRLIPELLGLSWVFYGSISVVCAVFGPWALGFLQLPGADYSRLFALVTAGVAFNAHTGVAYEFMQASGRYDRVVRLAAASLSIMLVAFFIAREWTGILAIGWAWLASQALTAVAADGMVLTTLSALSERLAIQASIRLGVVVAVVLSALVVLGAADRWALVLGGGLMAILLAYAGARIPLVRLGLMERR
jgi:O-antigen/teichoic acid export membrane protein